MSENEPGGDGVNPLEAIDKANQSASKGPLSALFTPSAEILGKKLEDVTRRIVEGKKENNQAHVEAVRAKIGQQEREPNAIALENLVAWEEPAGNYSARDPEADLWRGILDEILTGNSDQKELIEVAKKLNADDLATIGRFRQRNRVWDKDLNEVLENEIYSIEKLVAENVLSEEILIKPRIARILFIGSIFLSFSYITFMALRGDIFISAGDIETKDYLRAFAATGPATFVFYLSYSLWTERFRLKSRVWRLSGVGLKIAMYAAKYRQGKG